MKQILREIFVGLLIVIIVNICGGIISLPFGDPWEISPDLYKTYLNRQLLLTAFPAIIITFGFTRLRKTKDKSEALRRGTIWTFILGLHYAIIGVGNDNFTEIFGGIGVYVQLLFAFLGTFLYKK